MSPIQLYSLTSVGVNIFGTLIYYMGLPVSPLVDPNDA